MPEDRIVFIVGSPRSGTTWLHNMMSDHPQVVPLTARDFGFPDLVHEEAGVDQPVNETGAFLNYSPQHIKAVIERMRKAHPGKWLVEKTPTHALLLERIFRLYEQAKIVHIERDVKATLASYVCHLLARRALSAADNGWYWQHASNMIEAIHRAMREYKHDRRVYWIDYEELCHRQEAVLAGVCSFCGISVDAVPAIVARWPARCANDATVTNLTTHQRALLDKYARGLREYEYCPV